MSKRFFSNKCTNTHWLSKRWKLGLFENAILVTKLLIHSMINILKKSSLLSLTFTKKNYFKFSVTMINVLLSLFAVPFFTKSEVIPACIWNNPLYQIATRRSDHPFPFWEWITFTIHFISEKNNDTPPPAQSDQINPYLSLEWITLRMPRTTLAEDPTIRKTGKKKPTWKFQ